MDEKILFDMHTHSDNSPDGEHSVTLMCEKAIDMGLSVLAITDHCECNAFKEEHYDMSVRQSFFETTKAQAVFGRSISLIRGIELGQPTQNPEIAAGVLASRDYDFVLASLHNTAGRKDFYYLDYGTEDVGVLLDEYFCELCELASGTSFDSLAHITYPLRYITGREGIKVDLSRWQDQLDTIYRRLISSGRALEINTSTLSFEEPFTMPKQAQLRRYRELGGELITVGSDAHTALAVHRGVERGCEIARDCGFRYAAVFEKRRPRMVGI